MKPFKADFNYDHKYFTPYDCVVEKVIHLSGEQLDDFSKNLLRDYDFIAENIGLMRQDENDVKHCLLVIGDDREYGILVESEGYNYARYAAFVPNARQIIELQHAEQLAEEKQQQAETTELILAEDSMETSVYLANVQNCVGGGEQAMTLFGMLGCNFEDFHLCHCDEEHDLATISELNQNTLTEQGKTDWADVLNAKINRIYEGGYGLQIEVSDVEVDRLCDFSYMLAGQCSEKDYDRWVRQDFMETAEEKTEQEADESAGPALSM